MYENTHSLPTIKSSFNPLVDEHSKILILGTAPGPESLRLKQYYADPRNCFWKFISRITGKDIPARYKDRKRLLLQHGIAIWDVLHRFARDKGKSGDNSYIFKEYNDLELFLKKYPNIKAVFLMERVQSDSL
jgi:hypoxanthine-DNA glycosylase